MKNDIIGKCQQKDNWTDILILKKTDFKTVAITRN